MRMMGAMGSDKGDWQTESGCGTRRCEAKWHTLLVRAPNFPRSHPIPRPLLFVCLSPLSTPFLFFPPPSPLIPHPPLLFPSSSDRHAVLRCYAPCYGLACLQACSLYLQTSTQCCSGLHPSHKAVYQRRVHRLQDGQVDRAS